jgi:hypothetical protein
MMVDAALTRDIEDLRRFSESAGGDFALAALPPDPERRQPEGFLDPKYMKQIHALGFRMGASGDGWVRDSARAQAQP